MLLKTHKCKLPVLPPTQTSECELFSRKFMQFESRSLCPLTECKKCQSVFMQQIFKKYFKPSSTRDFTLLISFLEYLTISTTLRHCLTTRLILTYGWNYIESMIIVQLSVTDLKKVVLQPHTSSLCLLYFHILRLCLCGFLQTPKDMPGEPTDKISSIDGLVCYCR